MIVLVAGMPRSGSTFAFNIAREILERRGRVHQEPWPNLVEVIKRSGGADHMVCKTHQFDWMAVRLAQLGAMKSICTLRKPEDAVASWMETFDAGLSDAIETMKSWLILFERLKPYALLVPYEEIEHRPSGAAWSIARHLDRSVSSIEAAAIASEYAKERVKAVTDTLDADAPDVRDIGFSFYHAKTFFHRRHVSALKDRPARERIGDHAVATIREQLADQLDANGDLLI